METATMIAAILCLCIAIWEIRTLKKKLAQSEKSFKELSILYNESRIKLNKLLKVYFKEHKKLF
jgi:hypothetical protein